MNELKTTVGEILLEEFIKPSNISLCKLSMDTGILLPELNAILEGDKQIDMDISTKLGKYFDVSYEYFYNIDITCRNAK